MSNPFDFFDYRKNVLSVEGVPLSTIADKTGTPVYVYSASALLSSLKELQGFLKPVDHLICFAVKSNSNISVLRLLSEAGAGMDLVSGGELFRATQAGVQPNRIVFSGVGKTPGEMAAALERGIFSFNVESTAELETLNAVALQLGKRAPVALRFNPDVDAKTHPYISTGLKKNKFGLNKTELLSVTRRLEHYPGVQLKGISIHIGSQLLSLSPMDDAFNRTRELIQLLEGTLQEPLSFVDLGGGVGITYKSEPTPQIKKYCELIIKHFGPKSRLRWPLKILIEPGRSVSGNAGVLLTEVLYRKERGKKDFIVVDAAMNDLMRPALYGSHHEIVPVEKPLTRGPNKKADVVGPICESSDCFANDGLLSKEIASGDLLAILSAGAYGFTMSSNYNTRPRPPEVLVHNGEFKVIRERETYDDLIRGEQND
jgi:diaminopimelate decarboxylase